MPINHDDAIGPDFDKLYDAMKPVLRLIACGALGELRIKLEDNEGWRISAQIAGRNLITSERLNTNIVELSDDLHGMATATHLKLGGGQNLVKVFRADGHADEADRLQGLIDKYGLDGESGPEDA